MVNQESNFKYGIDFRVDVGQDVRKRRKDLGYSLETFAKLSKGSEPGLRSFEGGSIPEQHWEVVAIKLLDSLEVLEKRRKFKVIK